MEVLYGEVKMIHYWRRKVKRRLGLMVSAVCEML